MDGTIDFTTTEEKEQNNNMTAGLSAQQPRNLSVKTPKTELSHKYYSTPAAAKKTANIETIKNQAQNIEVNKDYFSTLNDKAASVMDIRSRNNEYYNPTLPGDQYEVLLQRIAQEANDNGPAAAEDLNYKYKNALQFAQIYGIPYEEAMENLDNLNGALWGRDTNLDYKGKVERLGDAWSLGTNTLRRASAGQDLKKAEEEGDEEAAQNALDIINAINKENELLAINQPQSVFMNIITAGVQSIPYTTAVGAAGLVGGLVTGGIGAKAASFLTGGSLASGDMYADLRLAGVKKEIAKPLSEAGGLFSAAIESFLLGKVKEMGERGAKIAGHALLKEHVGPLANKLTTDWLTNLKVADTGKKALLQAIAKWGDSLFEEGAEEFLQEWVEIGTRQAAKALSKNEVEIEDFDIWEAARQTMEAFKGGVAGAMLLGAPDITIDTALNIRDAKEMRKAAINTDSKEAFVNDNINSPVFEQFETDEEKKEAAGRVWENFSKEREAAIDETTAQIQETLAAEEGTEEYEETTAEGDDNELTAEYRTEEGKLYSTNNLTGEDTKGNNKGRFTVGNAEQENNNTYGWIDYTIDEEKGTVTIDAFKMAGQREYLRSEVYNEFAQNFSGYDIKWDAKLERAQAMKQILENNNPRGKENGLNYFATKDDIANQETRINVAKQLKSEYSFLTDAQAAADVAVMELAGKSLGLNLSEFYEKSFSNKMFGSQEELQAGVEAARAAGRLGENETVNGGMTFKKFNEGVRAVIYTAKNANFSTFSHEIAHVWKGMVSAVDTKQAKDLKTKLDALYGKDANNWTEAEEEQFVRGFEAFLTSGTESKGLTQQLKELYEQLAKFMHEVYTHFKNAGVQFAPELEEIYNKMLEGDGTELRKARDAVELANKQQTQNTVNTETEVTPASTEELLKAFNEEENKAAEEIVKNVDAGVEEKVDATMEAASDLMSELKKIAPDQFDDNGLPYIFQTTQLQEGQAKLHFQRTVAEAESIIDEELNTYAPEEAERIRKNLELHKGTGWYDMTVWSLACRRDIKKVMAGEEIDANSILNDGSDKVIKALKEGINGIFKYLNTNSFIGNPAKALYAVNSSLANCNPSKDCAKYCYVVKEGSHYRGANSVIKSELINMAVEADPVKAAKMVATQYKSSTDLEVKNALRLFDKGDFSEQWIPFVEQLNKEGVVVQVFSKRPELLQKIDNKKNVVMLSIDASNKELASQYPDLPIATVWDGEKDNSFLEENKKRYENYGGVVLPVKLGSRLKTAEEIKAIPHWASVKYTCPIDAGRKVIGEWNCQKCDQFGTPGCFYKRSVKERQILNKSTVEMDVGEWNELFRRLEDAVRSGAGRPGRESELLSLLVRERDAKLGRNDTGAAEALNSESIRMGRDSLTEATEKEVNPIRFQTNISDNELKSIFDNVQDNEITEEYKKAYYFDIQDEYVKQTFTNSDGTITAELEVWKQGKREAKEIDEALFFANKGFNVIILKERQRKAGESHPDLLINKKALVELKQLTSDNDTTARNRIIQGLSKLNSQVLSVFFVDKAIKLDYDTVIKEINKALNTYIPNDDYTTSDLLFVKDNEVSWYLKENNPGRVLPHSQVNYSLNPNNNSVNIEIDQIRQQFENTDKWLKAPNGQLSKLNEQQWLQVRTPSFKSWFGDWENDPQNASKVVDENGEPMVVYHGTPHSGFSVFKDTQASGDRSTSMHFFSDNLDLAKTYSGKDADPVYEALSDDYIDRPAAIYRTFLNLRNPKIIDFRGRSWNGETNGQREYWYKLNKDSDWKKYEAADYFADGDTINEADLIKYIKENDNVDIEGETDLYNAEYRTIEGLNVNTDEIGNKAKQEGYDGVIVKNVYDVGDRAWETAPTDPTTDYIVFKPNQIKSATHNSSDFSLSNDDIRFQTAYHGSGADFEKFDLNYGLTGEGSMSFGYGVYVTNSEQIARDYADRGGLKTFRELPDSVEKDIAEFMLRYSVDQSDVKEALKNRYDELIKEHENYLEKAEAGKGNFEDRQSYIERKKERIKGLKEEYQKLAKYIDENPGKDPLKELRPRVLYTVDIPDNGYLHWDKEVDDVSLNRIKNKLFEKLAYEPNVDGELEYEGVENILKKELDNVFNSTYNGSSLYGTLASYLGGEKEASLFLSKIGYNGINYPAGTIYGNGDGARNFVIFNEEAVDIMEKMRFQTEQELLADAATFDSWQDFMEVYTTDWLKPADTEQVPSGADAVWYQSVWEKAKGIFPTIGEQLEEQQKQDSLKRTNEPIEDTAMDAMFTSEMRSEGSTMLEDFMRKVDEILNYDMSSYGPADAEEQTEFENIQALQRRIRTQLKHGSWLSNVTRLARNGQQLTARARNTLLSLIEGSAREYRQIYAEVMQDDYWKPTEEINRDTLKTSKYFDLAASGKNLDELSPEEIKKISNDISNKEIKEKLQNKTLKLDKDLENYIKTVEKESRDLEKKLTTLEEETADDYKRISDWEQRRILEVWDKLQLANPKYDRKDAVKKHVQKAIEIAEKYNTNFYANVKADYNTIFRQWEDLRKVTEVSAELQEAIRRREELVKTAEEAAEKRKEKSATNRLKELRKQLVKRTMRRVPFARIDYNNAKTLIAIQRVFEPNLEGGVNKWIGTEGSWPRMVWSQYNTDSDARDKLTAKLLRTKTGIKVLKHLEETKTQEDFNKWTNKERQALMRVAPKEDWIKDLNLIQLDEEREQSIDLDIEYVTKTRSYVDEKGVRRVETYDEPVIGEDIAKLIKDALGPDMFNALIYKPFAEWTTEEMESLAKKVDQIYKEGKEKLAARRQAEKEQAESLRAKIQEAVKNTGIVINDDDTPEEKRRKAEKINKILGYTSEMKGTKADSLRRQSVFNRILHGYHDATVKRVARVLDNYSESTNVNLLYREENNCYNEEQRQMERRTDKIKRSMENCGINPEDLAQKVVFKDFYTGIKTGSTDLTLTLDELLYFLAANQDDNSREACMYGNLLDEKEREQYRLEDSEFMKLQDEKNEKAVEAGKAGDVEGVQKAQSQEAENVGEDGRLILPGTKSYRKVCEDLWDRLMLTYNPDDKTTIPATRENESYFLDTIAQLLTTAHFEGKNVSQEERQAYFNEQKNKKFITFLNDVMDDYNDEFSRMEQASIEEFNQPVNRVQRYVPLVRLSLTGDTNENRVRADLLATTTDAQSNAGTDRGMTQRRIKIASLYQRPVETGLIKTWNDALQRTEHFIAYAPHVRLLNRVYMSKAASPTMQWIESRYGKGMTEYIRDYIQEVATPNRGRVQTATDRFVRSMRGLTAPAYLGWKMSSVFKQAVTSPWPFMTEVSPAEYIGALWQEITNGSQFEDAIKSKSYFMRNRKMDPIMDLIDEEAAKQLDSKTRTFIANMERVGMQPLEWIDWVCVAPGWQAVYKKEYTRLTDETEAKCDQIREQLLRDNPGMDEVEAETKARAKVMTAEQIEKAAVDKADDVVRSCQPSNRKADLAPLFKNSGEIAKAVMQFTTSLNVIWNNLRYDTVYAAKNKEYATVVKTCMEYALAGICLSLLAGSLPLPGDDDDELVAKLRSLLHGATTQFTDSVPLIGSVLTSTSEKLITGKSQFSSGADLFPLLTKGLQGVGNVSKGEYEKAAARWLEAIGIASGLPVSGTKEAMYLFGIGDGNGELDFIPEALIGQRPQKKETKK